VDSTVKRLSASYDVRGLLEKAASHRHANVGMGAVLNEVALEYDRFNQLSKDRQAHGGAVDGSTPEVVYAYAPGTSRNTARRTSITYPSGFQQTLEYDGSTIDDRLSRVSGLKVSGETGWRVLYTYAGLGRLVQMHYPQIPGLSLNYQRINPATEPPGDGGDPYVGYDRFGRTEDLRWVLGANNPLRLLYGYDRDSRRTWRKDVSTGGDIGTREEDLAWNYDGLSQVTHAKRGALNINRTAIGGVPAQTEGFGYDETGNWLNYRMETDGVGTLEQTRKNDRDNRMTQVNGSSAGITYDQAGNMTQGPLNDSGPHHKLKWDAWNRLVEVRTTADVVVMTCGYDALFRRITKTAGGVTRHSYYSDRWKALEERVDPGTGTQTLSRRWFWGARPGHRDELVFRDRDTNGDGTLDERLYCLMDYFSPAAIVNLSGTVLERYTFSAFGKRRIMTEDYAARATSLYDWEFGFQGQFLDLETWNGTGEQTGIYNYGYRYYAPALGRWPSRDPIEERGGVNLYMMVLNTPVNFVDWLGLRAWMICNRCKGTSGPMRCISYDDQNLGPISPYTTNEGGDDMNKNQLKPGKYDIKPKTNEQMNPENKNIGMRNISQGKVVSQPTEQYPKPSAEFPEGTPSITGKFKGAKPGQATPGHKPTVRIHGPGESTGCVTTDQCGQIQEMMERNADHGGMTLEINEVCCKKVSFHPSQFQRQYPFKKN